MSISLAAGLTLWAASSTLILIPTWRIHRILRLGRPSLDAISFLFIYVLLVTGLLLALGLVGFLAPLPVTLGIFAVSLLTVLAAGLQSSLHAVRQDITAARTFLREWWRSLPGWVQLLTLAAAILGGLRFGFLIWALPPFVWDSLTYHLTNVAHWTQSGRIELFDVPVTRIFSAANYEVLTTWFTIFLRQDVIIEAAGLPFYLMGMIAVYAIARRIGANQWIAWLSALGYASTPALLLATTGTKNDPQMAGLFLAAMAFVLEGNFRREQSATNPFGHFVVIMLILAYAAGTKVYIVHLLPGLIVVGAIGALANGTEREWFSWPRAARDQFRGLGGRTKIGITVIMFLGVFLGVYWNTRNLILTGNPIYPYGVDVGQTSIVDGPHATTETSFGRLAQNLESLINKFGDRRGRIKPDLPKTTGWGWFAYGLGVPALIWAIIRNRNIRILTVGFVLALLVLLMSTRPSEWNMRYAIWFPAVFSLAFAVLLQQIVSSTRIPAAGITGLAVFCISMNFIMTLNYNQITIDQFDRMLALPTARRDASKLGFSMPTEYVEALDFVPQDELLGFNVHANGFIYPLYRADFSQEIVYVPISATDNCEQVVQTMEQRGTRWLIVAPIMTDDGNLALLRGCNEQGSGIRERAHNIYVLKPDE